MAFIHISIPKQEATFFFNLFLCKIKKIIQNKSKLREKVKVYFLKDLFYTSAQTKKSWTLLLWIGGANVYTDISFWMTLSSGWTHSVCIAVCLTHVNSLSIYQCFLNVKICQPANDNNVYWCKIALLLLYEAKFKKKFVSKLLTCQKPNTECIFFPLFF